MVNLSLIQAVHIQRVKETVAVWRVVAMIPLMVDDGTMRRARLWFDGKPYCY
jgi:hypothetical protein